MARPTRTTKQEAATAIEFNQAGIYIKRTVKTILALIAKDPLFNTSANKEGFLARWLQADLNRGYPTGVNFEGFACYFGLENNEQEKRWHLYPVVSYVDPTNPNRLTHTRSLGICSRSDTTLRLDAGTKVYQQEEETSSILYQTLDRNIYPYTVVEPNTTLDFSDSTALYFPIDDFPLEAWSVFAQTIAQKLNIEPPKIGDFIDFDLS